MKLENILNIVEKADAEVYERMDTRRDAMKGFAGMAGKVAAASVPLLFGSMFKKAYAGTTTTDVVAVLNFALTLEYLESTFYSTGVMSPQIQAAASAAELTALNDISADETSHVAFLQSAIKTAGSTPVARNSFTYDFTAGGAFPNVFTDYPTFLAVAQAFEDTGVRAYKGQAPALVGQGSTLVAALDIHSVEARHASYIRQLRKSKGATIKPWITLSSVIASGINTAVDASYAGEELTVQSGINIVGIAGNSMIDANAASEAFDEPLTTAAVIAIVKGFITSGI